MPRPTPKKPRKPAEHYRPFELEALPGLRDVAEAELRELRGVRGGVALPGGGIRFQWAGELSRLSRLHAPVAVYHTRTWAVPRPKAFLGHQVLGELAAYLKGAVREGGHTSFRIGAAGQGSDTFTRLGEALEDALGLPYDEDGGELLVRFRPGEEEAGWDVLARVTPRPLSARSWRACNMAGGLNATIAYAMHRLAPLREEDRIFNPMSGSGTLLIERALLGPPAAMVGVDVSEAAIACSRENIAASGKQIEVAQVDALATGLPDRSFDLVVSDLPWGDAVGSHGGNAELYPRFLREMDRLTAKRGRLVLLTHELRLFERVLAEQSRWHARELFQVYSGGHHPKCYLLTKSG